MTRHPYPSRPHHLQIRRDVQRIACPACHAPAGQQCLAGTGKPRSSLHRERWQAWRHHHTQETP